LRLSLGRLDGIVAEVERHTAGGNLEGAALLSVWATERPAFRES
jgi:hypothetical protein